MAIANPAHPKHEHLVSWSGGNFDPEVCDLAAINTQLAHLGPSPWATYDRLFGYDCTGCDEHMMRATGW